MALSTKQEKRFLGSTLFSGCEVKNYRVLAQSLAPLSILKGQRITTFPRQVPALGFLLEGCLDIYNLNGVLLCTLEPGDFFEVESMFSHIKPPLPLHIRARINAIITFLDKNLLIPVFDTDPIVARNYMKILADSLQNMTCRLNHFTAATPSVALSLYLLNNTQNILKLPDGLAGLARRLNISRATLYRALAELERPNLVTHHEKTVRILDREGLRHYAHIHSLPPSESFSEQEKRRSQ